MANKGAFVFLLFTDLADEAFGSEFGRWTRTEYLPKVLKLNGVLDGASYIATRGGPKYLTIFELESLDVAHSPEFKDLTAAPGRFLAKSGGELNQTSVLAQQFLPDQIEQADRGMAPSLQIGRMSVPAHIETEWNDWYDRAYVPGFRGVPGVIYARRFRVLQGSVRYMTIYEFEHDGVSETDAWTYQRTISSVDTPRMREASVMAPGSPGVYRRVDG